jgi:3-hydroxyisobutyrate dehydrogenase-like beta-hydroxyacid dehydrogenase
VVVVTAEQVRSVLFDADGLAVGAHPGLVVVVASTISMSDLADLQREAAEAGITLVDCGVTSPPREQHLKKVSAMVGADPEVYEHIRPVLEDFTQLTLLMGPPGAGMATKIARNLINYGGWRVAYEAALVAEAAGVDLGRMTELAARQEASGSPSLLWLRVKAGLFPSGGSTADQIRGLLCKDTRAVIELARAHGIELPVAQATLDSADDITAIWRSGEDGGDGQA